MGGIAAASLILALAVALYTPPARAADTYPSRPIRLVVGFGAGGPTDIPARYIADKLGAALGQPVIVENKPAAGGIVATRDVLAQPRDGYTLLLCTHFDATNTAVYRDPGYKLGDIAPVSLIVKYYYGLALANAIPADDIQSFVAYARAHPGEVTYATVGVASAQEIMALQLQKLTGVTLNRVPFRGGVGVVQELVAGRVDLYPSPTLAVMSQYQAKQLEDHCRDQSGAAEKSARCSDAQREGHRLRAFRLARCLRRRRHARADRQDAQRAHQVDRCITGFPQPDRKCRLDCRVLDAAGVRRADRQDSGRYDRERQGICHPAARLKRAGTGPRGRIRSPVALSENPSRRIKSNGYHRQKPG